MFHAELVGVFIIYLHTKFQNSSSIGSLFTSIKAKAKYTFRPITILLHYTLLKYQLGRSPYWRCCGLYSEVRATSMLVLS
jgi:hypothetical protein